MNEPYGAVGETPLMFACYFGHVEVARSLAEYPADLYAVNCFGENCLHYAAAKGHQHVVSFLTNFGELCVVISA